MIGNDAFSIHNTINSHALYLKHLIRIRIELIIRKKNVTNNSQKIFEVIKSNILFYDKNVKCTKLFEIV